MIRFTFFALLLWSVNSYGQWKDYTLNSDGDTLNRVDLNGKKQGPWVNHYDKLRGEPGYEEEGWYRDDRKEGEWHLYSLMGDMVGIEHYRWGLKDSTCQYFTMYGELKLEQSWKALNPDKLYDTLEVPDLDNLNQYRTVIVKNEGAAIKNGTWKYYDSRGALIRTEVYFLGELQNDPNATANNVNEKKEVPKPKEVLEFEQKNKGKKVRYHDGSTGGGG